MGNVFADIHCHPTLKPYGQSFTKDSRENSNNRKQKNSVWYYDPPTLGDKAINFLGGLTKFSQSNFTALGFGNVEIICASLYPMEKAFFKNKLGDRKFSDVLNDFITSVSQSRINNVQNQEDYFVDLIGEYEFLKQLDGSIITIDRQKYRYILAKNGNDIDVYLNTMDDVFTILVFVTIEGCHALSCGLDPENDPCNPDIVLINTQLVKDWNHRPVFVTFAHHFYNELCGHALSLNGLVGKVCDQSFGLDIGISELGFKVIKKLLDNSDGKRILIDIKHMSVKSRDEYYSFLTSDFVENEIPIIVSHGAVIGNDADRGLFMTDDINFADNEILKIAKSRGLFGLQLDERRIASKGTLQSAKGNISRKDILYSWAKLIWNQIQHVAELLDNENLFAWDVVCIGSDNDGIVNPLNGYWTSEEFDYLDDFLIKHAFNYENDRMKLMKNEFNQLKAEEIVNRFMVNNVQDFLIRNYH